MLLGPQLSWTSGKEGEGGEGTGGLGGEQPGLPKHFRAPGSGPRRQFLNFLVSGPKRSLHFALGSGRGRQLLGQTFWRPVPLKMVKMVNNVIYIFLQQEPTKKIGIDPKEFLFPQFASIHTYHIRN